MTFWFTYFRAWAILKRKSLYQYLFKARLNYAKFAVVCSPRSGSTWLHTLLNSHPQIISKGEIVYKFHKLNRAFNLNEHAFSARPAPIKAVGLKVFYGLENDIYGPALQVLRNDTTIKVIHLVREDKLAQFVSLKLAKKSREWSHQKPHKAQSIRIDPAQFQEFKDGQMKLQAKIEENFTGRMLTISYEDLIDNREDTLRLVQDFLGVKQRRLFSALKKQSLIPISDQIENWSDFEGLHKG